MPKDKKGISILYKNYRGESRVRTIVPDRIWFGSTQWHPDEQWLMDALDVEKDETRTFALRDMIYLPNPH